jgi:Predicted pyridoxal phosphate-dependent enzyme apparently involved in regulation of cell wall biogenesis
MPKKIPFHIPFEHPQILSRTLEWMSTQSIDDDAILKDLNEIYSEFHCAERAYKTYFTQSATQALEMMALSLNLKNTDEIIMPSYTYAATANAFARTGAKVIFADIEKETLNISSRTVAPLITNHTKAIIPIHYGGCAADLQSISRLIEGRNILLLEDAAHGIGSFYKGKSLGMVGEMGCVSFHHTKNIHAAGAGGVLYVNRDQEEHINNCDMIYFQGTNRLDYIKGECSKYSWQTLGGEYQMSNFQATYLLESLKYIRNVTDKRKKIFERYMEALLFHKNKWETQMSLIEIIEDASINGHIFPVIMKTLESRKKLLTLFYENNIEAVTHYEPLHQSIAGKKYGTTRTTMKGTVDVHSGLLRLPLYYSMSNEDQDRVIDTLIKFFEF